MLIDYPGPPQSLRVDYDDGGSFVLYWAPPKRYGGAKVIKYEVVAVRGGNIETKRETPDLTARVTLRDNNRYKIYVCSINMIGKNDSSCTASREINISELFCDLLLA